MSKGYFYWWSGLTFPGIYPAFVVEGFVPVKENKYSKTIKEAWEGGLSYGTCAQPK